MRPADVQRFLDRLAGAVGASQEQTPHQ
jgi:hypothetical protein